jgi:hypothetical protein
MSACKGNLAYHSCYMHTFSFLYVCSLKLFYLVKVSVLHTFYIRDIDIFGITVIMSVSRKVCFSWLLWSHALLSLEQNDLYCVGFQNGALQSKDGKDIVLLGGQHCTALANHFCFKDCVFEHTFVFLQIWFFQTSWLSMTWKIKSSGGLTTTVSAITFKHVHSLFIS